MRPSISICANVYAEKHAMPGWIEMATSGFFDDVFVVSSPPSDAEPDEETIEIVKKARIRLVHTVIDQGYGVVRTRCIREAKTDFVFVGDADERFYPIVPLMRCEGMEKYPDTKTPNLSVFRDREDHNQGELLRELVQEANRTGKDAVRLSRRHWFGAPGDYSRPCQNFSTIPDWQLRLVRVSPFVFFDPSVRIHERLLHSTTWSEPQWNTGDTYQGPWISHHHCFFKPMDAEKNARDMETYRRLDEGLTKGMWLEHADGVKE